MLEVHKESSVVCAHCGKPADDSAKDLRRLDSISPWFCCMGCQTVYQLLQSSGLSRYYDLKNDGVCFNAPTPVVPREGSFSQWNSPERRPRIYLEGIHCTACLWLIEQLPVVSPVHVVAARLDLGRSILQLTLTPDGELAEVAKLLESWGYHPHYVQNDESVEELLAKENRRHLLELGVSAALAGNIMLMSVPLYAGLTGNLAHLFEWISAVLATISVFYSGRSFFKSVVYGIRRRQFSVDVPILLAILVAYFYSMANLILLKHNILYFDSLAMLIFLLLGSRYLLARLRQYGLGSRLSLQVLSAHAKSNEGDEVSLRAGQELAFDGRIQSGQGLFDQAFLTGESWPVLLRAGDSVYAGTKFVGGMGAISNVTVKVTGVGRNTRIEKILNEVRQAQTERSNVEKNFDRWARQLLMVVVLIAAGALFYWASMGEWNVGLQRTLALLIVTCPCALALATPLAQSLMWRRAFARGLFVKDVEAFEKATHIQKVFFDKTGTLTTGQMEVDEIQLDAQDFAPLRALTGASRHPVSRAIYANLGLGEVSALNDVRETPGVGVEARVNGVRWRVQRAATLNGQERRPAVEVYRDGQIRGRIFLRDHLRDESSRVISDLLANKMSVGVLSGDRTSVVQSVVRPLGISESQVSAELLPEEKARKIKSEEDQGVHTLMVGDGLNDALAMSYATLSIGVQGGLEAGIRNATVTLLRPGLRAVNDFFIFARDLQKIHRLNFFYSTLYNAISGVLALAGYMNPLFAAVIMPLSAVTVFGVTVWSVRASKT